jgi:ribokinase
VNKPAKGSDVNNPVVVLGSINIDHVTVTDRFPLPGETITGKSFFTAIGGKGANQAVAAAKCGANVIMLGTVGLDSSGGRALEILQESGVRTDAVLRSNLPTGTAHITVNGMGENSIIVVPGANHHSEGLTAENKAVIGSAAILLLLQLEVPFPLIEEAASYAKDHGVFVVLTPAPVQPLPKSLLTNIDLIVANEGESLAITSQEEPAAAAAILLSDCKAVLITSGERGCHYTSATRSLTVPAFKVPVVDTTAAGDTFIGAVAACLTRDQPVAEALKWASAAAALTVGSRGAIQSMPCQAEVESFLETH